VKIQKIVACGRLRRFRNGLWLAHGCRNDGIILHEMTYMLSDSSPADSNSGSKRSYRLKAHVHKITSVDFSHDSHLLASCSWDKSIVIWGVHLRQQFARIELTAWPTALVWAPSRLLLACATMDSRVVVHLASLHFHLEFLQLSAAALAPVADLRAHQEGVWSLPWSYLICLDCSPGTRDSRSARSISGLVACVR
jgi:WD40 repeat protein